MEDFYEQMNRTINNIINAVENPKPWMIMTGLFYFFNQYIFSQWNFALGFFIIFLIDTFSGSYIAYRRKEFCFRLFKTKLMDKTLAYFSILVCYSVGTKIVLEDASDNLIRMLDIPFYSLFITAEIFSVVRNWYKYKRWPVLRQLMKHFKGFDDETGKAIPAEETKQEPPTDPCEDEKDL